MDKRIEQIKACEEKIRELSATEENRRRQSLWTDDETANDYIWHPRPRSRDIIPFSFEIERAGYAKILGFSLKSFYTDPVEFVLRSLEMSIYRFEEYADCTPIGPAVTYWPGVGYEMSLFGMPQIYTEEDAWVGRDHVIKERVPIESLEIPDFYEHPVMKETHAFFERMRELLSDDFALIFPQWCRSSWGVAWQLRGIDDLIFDYIEDPEWLSAFLDFLTEARFRWSDARAKMLGIGHRKANLFNDEVNAPVVSPSLYKDVIFKSEKDVSDYFGGINYWHSCGNTTVLISLINELPGVDMVHVSPWTDVQVAADGYSDDKTLEVVLHPLRDVLQPESDAFLRKVLEDVKRICAGRSVTVRADGFEIMRGIEADVAQMKHWVAAANEILLDA
ncbi:MAG: hypothetical protein LBR44_10925 [Clostridiales Family XIII bacterium]|jgi:hypothetical protein|nr:hypothetical protein [Clostridiales Family XIII bacterium]